MASTSDIRKGLCIKYNHDIYIIIEFLHVKPGKGPAFVRTNLKDISSGKIIDETFNAGVKLEFLKIEAKEMQFLYSDTDSHIFMDSVTYEQFNVSNDQINDNRNYLKPGMNVDLLFDNDEVLDIRLPAHIVLDVIETEPGVKGNTATGATKPATVETDYTIQVPLFIDNGDLIKIDTRSGEYIERVKT